MNANQEPLHYLVGPGEGAGWHCLDCAPAAVLSRNSVREPRTDWPEPSTADRCATCGVSRTDMAAELAVGCGARARPSPRSGRDRVAVARDHRTRHQLGHQHGQARAPRLGGRRRDHADTEDASGWVSGLYGVRVLRATRPVQERDHKRTESRGVGPQWARGVGPQWARG